MDSFGMAPPPPPLGLPPIDAGRWYKSLLDLTAEKEQEEEEEGFEGAGDGGSATPYTDDTLL